MPLYEYACKKCHHRFERIQKFSDPHPKKCPKCGGPIEQVLSPPAVQFKGSGWYVTDYAKKAAASGAKGDSADKAEKSEKPEKTEAKDSTKAKSESKKSTEKHK